MQKYFFQVLVWRKIAWFDGRYWIVIQTERFQGFREIFGDGIVVCMLAVHLKDDMLEMSCHGMEWLARHQMARHDGMACYGMYGMAYSIVAQDTMTSYAIALHGIRVWPGMAWHDA